MTDHAPHGHLLFSAAARFRIQKGKMVGVYHQWGKGWWAGSEPFASGAPLAVLAPTPFCCFSFLVPLQPYTCFLLIFFLLLLLLLFFA